MSCAHCNKASGGGGGGEAVPGFLKEYFFYFFCSDVEIETSVNKILLGAVSFSQEVNWV